MSETTDTKAEPSSQVRADVTKGIDFILERFHYFSSTLNSPRRRCLSWFLSPWPQLDPIYDINAITVPFRPFSRVFGVIASPAPLSWLKRTYAIWTN